MSREEQKENINQTTHTQNQIKKKGDPLDRPCIIPKFMQNQLKSRIMFFDLLPPAQDGMNFFQFYRDIDFLGAFLETFTTVDTQ